MKRLLSSLIVIGAISAAIGTGSMALFTDTDSIDANVINTATVSIDAAGEAGAGIAAKPVLADNLVPGEYSDWHRGRVLNNSTVPVKLYMYVTNVQGSACPKTNLRVTTGHAGGDETAREIFNGKLSDLSGAGNRQEVTGEPPFQSLPVGWSQVVRQIAQLDVSADNSYQNTSCTWDEVFVAENLTP